MKISKSLLEEIIQEELTNVLGEWWKPPARGDYLPPESRFVFVTKWAETMTQKIRSGDIKDVEGMLDGFAGNLDNLRVLQAMEEVSEFYFRHGPPVPSAGQRSPVGDTSPNSDRWQVRRVKDHGFDKFREDVLAVTKKESWWKGK